MTGLLPKIVMPAGNKRIRTVVPRRFIPDFEGNFEDATGVGVRQHWWQQRMPADAGAEVREKFTDDNQLC
jgi:hypothetical protein